LTGCPPFGAVSAFALRLASAFGLGLAEFSRRAASCPRPNAPRTLNQRVEGSSPSAPTTQSCTNTISCGLSKNPLCSATLARTIEAFSVSAAGEVGLRGQNAARSLARANPFPADFVPTDRDGFACRLRPVRIRGRWALERKGRRSVTADLNEKSNEAAQRRQGRWRLVECRRSIWANLSEKSNDAASRRRVAGACSGREAEHAVLAIPFGGGIDQPGQPDAVGQPALHCGLDQ
jgi:hypothetical protein